MSQEDYYTAMVMAASNYADPMQHHPKQRNNPYGPPSGMLFTGGASSSYCSSNNSSASSINQSSSNFIRKRSGAVGRGGYCTLLRKPTMENGPMHETSYNLPTSMMMSRGEVVGQPPQLQAPATYTHNPYATSSGCTSNDTSMNASVESYHSQYSASYAVPSLTQQPPRQGAEYGYGDASNLGEQFHMVVGNIAATACTTRGRHLLVSVLRLQHMDKIDVIFQELLPEIDTVALDGHGCHVVRTLVEFISTSQLVMMIEYLQPSTITHLATSTQHTRRVLQVMFERHRSELLTPLVEIIAADCRRLSMTQQGCITIMRLIENAMPEQKQLIMNKLLPVFPALTVDPYGNYVVQTIVQNMDRYTTVDIITGVFTGHWLSLSCNKYASNVMERVVWQMSGVARSLLVQELVFESSSLRCLIQDSFGNFVLQAIIDSSKDLEEFQTIYDLVMPSLQSSPYRNKIEARLKGRLHALQQEAEGEAA